MNSDKITNLYTIKVKTKNLFLNPNWKKRLIPLLLEYPNYYNDYKTVSKELLEVNNKYPKENLEIVKYFVISELEFKKITNGKS